MKKRVDNMTTKQLSSYLEALKIIVEKAKDKSEILKAIEQIQERLKE